MIESIEKVRVNSMTDVLQFSRKEVEETKNSHGVYLIFKPIGKDMTEFRNREYCCIGCATGTGVTVRIRLQGRLRVHEKGEYKGEKLTCGPLESHYFQVLYCADGIDAARLESLFHLWHGNHEGGHSHLEPSGKPKATVEPDFFYLQSK